MKTNLLPLTLTQAIEGYLLHTEARALSQHTLADYQNTYRKLLAHLNADPPIDSLTPTDIEAFLAAQPVSKKTRLNYHTGLSALWTWCYKNGYVRAHVLRQVERPKPHQAAIEPFTDTDLRAILNALSTSRTYKNHGAQSAHTLPNQDRNRAIILTLLDTGARAEELCNLQIQDYDPKNVRLHIRRGKGDKERYLPICAKTASAIWKTLTPRQAALPTDPLFVTLDDLPLDRHRLRQQLKTIGARAGVPDCHPHRFRHTFAISYLRNGGDIYSLQAILGHSTLEMCRLYLRLAQTDIASAHRRASPVGNLRF